MSTLFVLRWAHIIGSTVLLGTGIGIAFFMLIAHRTKDPVLIAHTAGAVVLADYIFTATAVIVQPITGILLMQTVGWTWAHDWIKASIALYFFIGALWLPVVWMQTTMRNLARESVAQSKPLPARYFHLFRLWFVCGVPAFIALLAIFWLMVAKPAF